MLLPKKMPQGLVPDILMAEVRGKMEEGWGLMSERGKMYEGSQKSREGSSTKDWSVASLTWRYKVWRCIRNLSDPLSEIREPPFLYHPVHDSGHSNLRLQTPRGNTCRVLEVTRADSRVCKNGWKKKNWKEQLGRSFQLSILAFSMTYRRNAIYSCISACMNSLSFSRP